MNAIRAVAVLSATLLAIASAAVRAQAADGPVMLIAKPGLEPPYGETVLIAVPAGNAKHAGFIVNRPLRQTLAQLFPESPAAQKAPQPVRLGGPLMLDTMFAVLQAGNEDDDTTIRLFDNVHMAFRADSINEIVQKRPADARYFIGFVSWEPGELAEEIQRGYWYVMRPQADVLFRDDVDGVWDDLVRRARSTVNFIIQ
jgi:putative transcriptional regulator